MSDAFQSIKQGLTEAIQFAQGQTSGAIVHEYAPLLTFNNDEEAAAWFDTHDTAEFIATAPELETPLQLIRTAQTR